MSEIAVECNTSGSCPRRGRFVVLERAQAIARVVCVPSCVRTLSVLKLRVTLSCAGVLFYSDSVGIHRFAAASFRAGPAAPSSLRSRAWNICNAGATTSPEFDRSTRI